MRQYLPEIVALPLLPFLFLQGRRTRRITLRLPEADGPCRGACEYAQANERKPTLKVLSIGESPVAGVGVDTHEQAISAQFGSALAHRLQRTVAWHALGKNGATVGEALHNLLPEVPSGRFDIILVAFGVNDTTAFKPVARWRRDMTALLDALERRCQPQSILLSGVPPIGRFPALPQPLRWIMGLKADSLDRSLRAIAANRANTLHVPLALAINDPELMARDGYHPSSAGCAAWAALLAEAYCRTHTQDAAPDRWRQCQRQVQ